MKYFIVSETGEVGPFPPATINRMFQKGQVRGEQLCREEGSRQTRRLDEVFRHFAPSQEVVKEARKNVARWNLEEGTAAISTGLLLFGFGILRGVLSGNPGRMLLPFGFGVALIVGGVRQQSKGRLASAKIEEDEAKAAKAKDGAPGPSSEHP